MTPVDRLFAQAILPGLWAMAIPAGTLPAPEGDRLTDTERIARLDHVVGTLISWLMLKGLRPGEVAELLAMLNAPPPAPSDVDASAQAGRERPRG